MENSRVSFMFKAVAVAAIGLTATLVMLVQDPSDTVLGGGYPELWRKAGLAGAPTRATACIFAGVLLLAMGWLYRLLFRSSGAAPRCGWGGVHRGGRALSCPGCQRSAAATEDWRITAGFSKRLVPGFRLLTCWREEMWRVWQCWVSNNRQNVK